MWPEGSVEGRITLAIIKPDGVARGLAEEIWATFARAGLTACRPCRSQLDPEVATALIEGDTYRQSPIKAAMAVAYLTKGPVETALLVGDDAIDVARAVKALVRTANGSNEVINVLHTTDSPAELAHQATILYPEEGAPRGAAHPAPGHPRYGDLSPAALGALVAELIDSPGRGCDPQPLGSYVLTVADDTVHSVDDLARALHASFPDLDARTRVGHAVAVKAVGVTHIPTGSIVAAGRAWRELADVVGLRVRVEAG